MCQQKLGGGAQLPWIPGFDYDTLHDHLTRPFHGSDVSPGRRILHVAESAPTAIPNDILYALCQEPGKTRPDLACCDHNTMRYPALRDQWDIEIVARLLGSEPCDKCSRKLLDSLYEVYAGNDSDDARDLVLGMIERYAGPMRDVLVDPLVVPIGSRAPVENIVFSFVTRMLDIALVRNVGEYHQVYGHLLRWLAEETMAWRASKYHVRQAIHEVISVAMNPSILPKSWE